MAHIYMLKRFIISQCNVIASIIMKESLVSNQTYAPCWVIHCLVLIIISGFSDGMQRVWINLITLLWLFWSSSLTSSVPLPRILSDIARASSTYVCTGWGQTFYSNLQSSCRENPTRQLFQVFYQTYLVVATQQGSLVLPKFTTDILNMGIDQLTFLQSISV